MSIGHLSVCNALSFYIGGGARATGVRTDICTWAVTQIRVFGLADRYLILIVTKCYRDI